MDSSWFKNGDFKNHILNENNIYLTTTFLNDIFKKYHSNHRVKNLNNFQTAVTHVSYLKKSFVTDKTALLLKDIPPISNDKKINTIPLQTTDYNTFEFLGDSVIHLALTEYLRKRYPTKNQGFLTKLRTKLEKSDTLSFLAKKMNLHTYAIIARNMEISNARVNDPKLTEDIFESFICALFKESDYETCKHFIVDLIETEIDLPELICTDDNYKEKIMHYFNKMKWKFPKYVESNLSRKNNLDVINQVFVVHLQNQEGEILGTGTGNLKTKAEQDAARDALIKLNALNSNEDSDSDNITTDDKIDYTTWFINGNFTDCILNEKNIIIEINDINKIFEKYNIEHKVKNYLNYFHSMIHVSYLNKTSLKEKTALLLKDIPPIQEKYKKSTVPLQETDYSHLSHIGNAVIHLAFTEYLSLRYSMKNQGFLTKLRIKMEKAETLSELAKKLKFDKYAIIAKNMELNDARNLDATLTKNIFEAFIGSVFLETNYKMCYDLLKELIENEIDFSYLLETDDNYKGQLMQYFHKLGWKDPVYEDLEHDVELKNFVVCVKNIKGNTFCTGKSNTKIKAAQEAARLTLEQLNIIDENENDNNKFYDDISTDNDTDTEAEYLQEKSFSSVSSTEYLRSESN